MTLKKFIDQLDKQSDDINVLNATFRWLIKYNDWDSLTFKPEMLSFDLENISTKDNLPKFSYRCKYIRN